MLGEAGASYRWFAEDLVGARVAWDCVPEVSCRLRLAIADEMALGAEEVISSRRTGILSNQRSIQCDYR